MTKKFIRNSTTPADDEPHVKVTKPLRKKPSKPRTSAVNSAKSNTSKTSTSKTKSATSNTTKAPTRMRGQSRNKASQKIDDTNIEVTINPKTGNPKIIDPNKPSSRTSCSKETKAKTATNKETPKKLKTPNINAKRPTRKNKTPDTGAYSSIKKKPHTLLPTASGASTRGSVEADINRFRIVWAVGLILLLILIGRAIHLQVTNAYFYQQKGTELITSERTQKAYRGMIVDRNNLPLAISAPLSTVTFSPYDYALRYYNTKKQIAISDPDSRHYARMVAQLGSMDLSRLASLTGVPLETLQKTTQIDESVDVMDSKAVNMALPKGTGSHYLLLLNKVTPEIAEAVMSLDFAGVYEEKEFRRYYPQAQPSAQLLGFMGYNNNDPEAEYSGRAGIERLYDAQLRGTDGKILVLNDARRNSLKQLAELEPVIPGEDIQLTIDSRLQYLLYTELEKVGRLQQARWASGMVVDVQTGEVLALSTWPSFNSNNLNEMTGDNQRNRALLDVFEPGSVMKPFTVAAALDSGQYNTNTLINTSPGFIRVKGYTINDHGNLGSITMATLLQKSSNVASTKIALSLPATAIVDMQRRFGFGQKTALGFPGESAGFIPTPEDKETARRATLSYGYGLQVTLAQIAQAYATLGAGGVRHPLTLIENDELAPAQRVLDQKNAEDIVEMMELVTQPGGTAVKASIDGYQVAGKTGTSRRVNPDGGYYNDQYRTVFAGLAPASNPRFSVVILVEDPTVDQYAGDVAAPVFANVMKDALRLYNVPLDKPLDPINLD